MNRPYAYIRKIRGRKRNRRRKLLASSLRSGKNKVDKERRIKKGSKSKLLRVNFELILSRRKEGQKMEFLTIIGETIARNRRQRGTPRTRGIYEVMTGRMMDEECSER